jgi:predicted 3-demethylubiquinone-9 3-methyltransferase (glyoxalase superfamily)
MKLQKITPFLWFDNQAEEAATFYVSLFKNAKMGDVARHGEGGPAPGGSAMVVSFELEGIRFTALNGGPMYKFTEAVSFYVDCENQEEVDYFWGKLSEGGKIQQCGWLKDKFGLSWQIIPSALPRLLSDPDRKKAGRAMQAMLKMKKLDVAALEKAAAG